MPRPVCFRRFAIPLLRTPFVELIDDRLQRLVRSRHGAERAVALRAHDARALGACEAEARARYAALSAELGAARRARGEAGGV